MTEIVDVSRIRALNDDLRRSLAGGVLMMTAGVIALGRAKQIAILDAVAAFDDFDADDDPYGEGDFGALEVEGERIFFKVDLYEPCQTPRQRKGETGKLVPLVVAMRSGASTCIRRRRHAPSDEDRYSRGPRARRLRRRPIYFGAPQEPSILPVANRLTAPR